MGFAASAVNSSPRPYLCPAHRGLCTALLRHKVLCHVVCDLVLVNAQLCTMLTIPVGLRRAVSVPLHRVVVSVDLEQYAELRHCCKSFHRVIVQGGLDAAITEHTVLQAALCCGAGLEVIEIGHDHAVGFHLAGGVLEDGAAMNRRNLLADALGGSVRLLCFVLVRDNSAAEITVFLFPLRLNGF